MITADEFDAVAVHQSTGLPAVALPSGTSALPPEVRVYTRNVFLPPSLTKFTVMLSVEYIWI